MATHKECLKRYPQELLYKFPAVLTHRAGLHVTLAESLRPLMDKGLRPEPISDWLLEMHSVKYMRDVFAGELVLERKRNFQHDFSKPMFSDFDDKKLYNGRVPTGAYICARCVAFRGIHASTCKGGRGGHKWCAHFNSDGTSK
jgi:hypothetical protein